MRHQNLNRRMVYALFCLFVTALNFTSCKKSDPELSDLTLKNSKSQMAVGPNALLLDVNANADAAFDAYNTSFLVTSGNTQYYKEALNVSSKDYFWRQALDIQMVEDVYLRTKSAAHKTLITNLLNTFLQQNQGSGSLYDWDWNDYNDDLQWAGIAFARGYQITGNTTFLNQAKYAFNRSYDRGWTTELDGGLWWDVSHQDKSGLSNNPEMILGCYIYEATKDITYLNKSIAIYNWVKSKLYNASTGAVYENILPNGTVSSSANVYNIGAFVGAANHLHRLTGNSLYYDDAKRSVDYVRNNKTVNGILTNGTRQGTWQSEFVRALGEFVRDNNLWSTYYTWMKQNADAAWSVRRTDKNLIWNTWTANTPSDNITTALECVGGVIMQQVTPITQPAGIVNNSIYRLSPKINANSALDILGTPIGSLAEIWQWNAGPNQKFKLISADYGYYRLVPQHNTNASLDVTGANPANDTPIEIYTTQNNNSAQLFKLVYDYDGYYKLKPKCAPSSCLNVKANNPADGAKIVLWQEANGDNERFSLSMQ
ncbi:glycoside hydrolase family 76 protein [Pedobacter soli]|uniref:Predicted alpha-1,6-mannanase, GH76 family n=1 Tax=Pedobacter soli TaxID=390242 RepID=A0A1G6ZKE0_9SPHI|nr:glycoside hydrolase family 76 protein [Pedobacter soli]SDE02285.1 Predicted alpha-1,6-mannanase, GH76 family [Pedobacter soli]